MARQQYNWYTRMQRQMLDCQSKTWACIPAVQVWMTLSSFNIHCMKKMHLSCSLNLHILAWLHKRASSRLRPD